MTQLLLPLELQSILTDIRAAINTRLYYPALLVTLTLPEICSALALDNNVFVKEKHYVSYVDKYTICHKLGVSGIECYRLRGGVVHRASPCNHPHFVPTAVIFTVPESRMVINGVHITNPTGEGLFLDLLTFCVEMESSVRRWFDDHKQNSKVEENLQHLIRYSQDGIFPYLVGVPVVASGK